MITLRTKLTVRHRKSFCQTSFRFFQSAILRNFQNPSSDPLISKQSQEIVIQKIAHQIRSDPGSAGFTTVVLLVTDLLEIAGMHIAHLVSSDQKPLWVPSTNPEHFRCI